MLKTVKSRFNSLRALQINKILAAGLAGFVLVGSVGLQPVFAQSPFGNITAPPGVNRYGNLTSGGFIKFITAILRTMIVLGALYSLVNFVLAGYQYMSAANDPKALQGAWGKIWQSLLGLVVMVGAFILAAVFGYILTQDAGFILNPQIYGP